MIGDKKGIYHSTLSKFGPAFVTITSDVFKSKYPNKDGSDKYCVTMEHEGDEQTYTVENDDVGRSLQGLKGLQVTLTASGGREGAAMDVKVKEGQEAPQKPAGAPPARSSAPKAKWSGAGAKDDYWARKEAKDAEREPKIMRQHSQEMALRYFDVIGGGIPDFKALTNAIDWFQKDIEHVPGSEASKPAPASEDEIPF